ncbi:MAG TPA: hypothetical protein VFE47_31070 [Tepidisphaeraceae bacterium]|nr:hypothetical protein [Tepidisphaeraceae bacterium]
MANDPPQPLDYERHRRVPRWKLLRKVLFNLNIVLIPSMLFSGLAVVDGSLNRYSDFIAGGWLVIFVVCAIGPTLSVVLWRLDRKARS